MGTNLFMPLNSRSGQAQSSSAVSVTQEHEVTVSQSKLHFGCSYTETVLTQTTFSELPVLNLFYIRETENHRLQQHFILQYPLIDYSLLKVPLLAKGWLRCYHLTKDISVQWSDCSALQKQLSSLQTRRRDFSKQRTGTF